MSLPLARLLADSCLSPRRYATLVRHLPRRRKQKKKKRTASKKGGGIGESEGCRCRGRSWEREGRRRRREGKGEGGKGWGWAPGGTDAEGDEGETESGEGCHGGCSQGGSGKHDEGIDYCTCSSTVLYLVLCTVLYYRYCVMHGAACTVLYCTALCFAVSDVSW